MPRRVRPPTRHPEGGKLETLTTKGRAPAAPKPKPAEPRGKSNPKPAAASAKTQPSQATAKEPKSPSLPKQPKVSEPPRTQPRSRRSLSETRVSSSNSSDEDYQPPIRVRNSSETRFDRRREDVKALQDIYRLQATTQLLIPKMPFARLIREVLMQYMYRDFRITPECLNALQEAAEMYMVQVFEDSYRCCLHRNRVTLDVPDMKLALYLRERWRP